MRLRNIIATLSAIILLVTPAATAAAAPVRPVSPDADFLIAVHQANLTQIKAGKIAAKKGESATVRDLGQQFVTFHRKLDAQVKKTARTVEVRLPDSPNSEQTSLIRQYKAASTAEFDTLFVASQILAHQRAFKMAQVAVDTGTNPSVKSIVATATPVVQKHYAALQQMDDAAEQ
jgi:putative membrane protein